MESKKALFQQLIQQGATPIEAARLSRYSPTEEEAAEAETIYKELQATKLKTAAASAPKTPPVGDMKSGYDPKKYEELKRLNSAAAEAYKAQFSLKPELPKTTLTAGDPGYYNAAAGNIVETAKVDPQAADTAARGWVGEPPASAPAPVNIPTSVSAPDPTKFEGPTSVSAPDPTKFEGPVPEAPAPIISTLEPLARPLEKKDTALVSEVAAVQNSGADIDPKVEKDTKSKINDLVKKYGVPILGLIQAATYGYTGNKEQTLGDIMLAEKQNEKEKEYVEKLDKAKREYEENRAKQEREWQERLSKEERAFTAEQNELSRIQQKELQGSQLSAQEKLTKMELEGRAAAARAGGGVPITPQQYVTGGY